MLYKLSPSDLTFLWDSCKYCFYLKVKHNIVYRGTFPGIFSKMGGLTSQFYLGKPTALIAPHLPSGFIQMQEKWVKSVPIAVPGSASQCYIRGRLDALVLFEDGSYGVIDYKTSDASAEKADFYSRQLSAYAYALEYPAPGALHLSPVSRLGLFIITPERYEPTGANEMAFISKTTWLDVPRNDAAFLTFLGDVLAVLDSPTPPSPSETCELCNYRNQISNMIF